MVPVADTVKPSSGRPLQRCAPGRAAQAGSRHSRLEMAECGDQMNDDLIGGYRETMALSRRTFTCVAELTLGGLAFKAHLSCVAPRGGPPPALWEACLPTWAPKLGGFIAPR